MSGKESVAVAAGPSVKTGESGRPITLLREAICNKGLKEDYQAWVQWLESESVPSSEKCAELQSLDEQGWCPLHYAARHYSSDLLCAALDVDEVDFDVRTRETGLTPLLVAASYNRKNAVLWLLQDGRERITEDATDCEGRNAVHLACLDLQCQYTIEPLVRQLDYLCHKKDSEGNTPLHLAARLGNMQAIENGLLSSEIWDQDSSSDVEGGSEGSDGEGGSEGSDGEEEEEKEEGSEGGGSDGEGSDGEGEEKEGSKGEGEGEGGEEGSEGEGGEGEKEGKVGSREGEKGTGPGNEDGDCDEDSNGSSHLRKMIGQRNNDGKTPLHLAVENGKLEVTSRLISLWPKVILEADNEADLPLHQACRHGNRDIVEVLLQQDQPQKDIELIQLARLCLDLKYCNKKGETPLHCAAYNAADSGALVELLMLTYTDDIKHQALQLRNTDQYTPLMLATTHGKPDVVRVLLRHGSAATQRMDVLGENLNCLEAAIEKGKSEVARVIVEHEGWAECLRSCTRRDRVENTPFRRMIKKMPDLAQTVLTKCVRTEGNIRSETFQVQLDFGFLQDMQDARKVKEKHSLFAAVRSASTNLLDPRESTRWPPTGYQKDNHVLAIMVEHKCEGLLQHPLVVTLLNEKWFQFGAWLYMYNLLLYLLQVIFLTSFSLIMPHPLSSACSESVLSSLTHAERPSYVIPYITGSAAVLICCIDLLMQFNQFLQLYRHDGRLQWYINWGFWRSWHTYLNIQIPMLVFTIVFVSSVHEDCLCAAKWQWRVGTVIVFVAWIRLFFELHQFPKIGLYVEMLQKILQQFINVSVVAAVLVFSFGIPFYMAFYDPAVEDSPFGGVWYSLMSIIVYTVGGPDNIVLELDREWKSDHFLFPVISYLLWIIFIVAMSVLFLNLLTGLAVGDVQEIRDNATVEQLAKRVKLLLDWEQTYINYRSLELPTTVSPNSPRGQHDGGGGSSHFWQWFVDAVFSLKDDLYDISTIKTLLYPEEDTEDKINWLRVAVLQLQQRGQQQERAVREGLQDVVGRLTRLLESSEQQAERQEAMDTALKELRTGLDKTES